MLRGNLFRLLAGVLVLAAVAHVVTLWPRVASLASDAGPHGWIVVAVFAVSAITALAACGLALLLLWRVPNRPDARALTLFLAFLAIFWGSVFRFLHVEWAADGLSISLSYGGGWVSDTALASFLLALAAFLRFSALFPRPLTRDRLRPSRAPRLLRVTRLATLRPGAAWGGAAALLLVLNFLPDLTAWATGSPASAAAAFLAIMLLLTVFAGIAMVLGARNLLDSYRSATPGERKRILWLVSGFSAAAWMLIGAAALMTVAVTLDVAGTPAVVVVALALVLAPLTVVFSAATGILYSGALEPGLALRRSTLYGLLGVIGLVAYTAVETALSELVERWVPLPGFIGPVAAGVLVALVLIPLRKIVARRLPGPGEPPAPATEAGPG